MYENLNLLLRPGTAICLVLVVALARMWRRRREAPCRLGFVLVTFLVFWCISTPAVSYFGYTTLERPFSPLAELPDDCEALVVLSGGVFPRTAKRPNVILADDSLYRCLHAAELYHRRGRCLVVLTGGAIDRTVDAPPVALAMRDFMLQLGVVRDDLAIEDQSASTYENALECHRLFEERRIKRMVLVTEANHMRRAVACFRKTGMEVTPAPCQFVTGRFEVKFGSFLPSPGAAMGSEKVAHEWLGMLWYWLHGRI
ncbi:MAG TPA: YdcF family protein [Pirellulales bacterium]|jgi:uncharacterized SAM-binding protein YcdF (DUF218 family)|nr:YdcF family protein [Pirellulales bacterium]